MSEQENEGRKAVFFMPPETFQPGSEVNHYEGAPKDLPFPTDGSPIYIDHPMFAYDKAISRAPRVIALSHWPYVDMVARADAEGQPFTEETRLGVQQRSDWLSGKIPIPQEDWEAILHIRRFALTHNGYPADHPFGAPFITREDKEIAKWDRKEVRMSARKRRKRDAAESEERAQLDKAKAMIPDLFHKEGCELNEDTLEYEPVDDKHETLS